MFNESTKLDRILSQCIHAIEVDGWTVEQCLDRYPKEREELEPLLQTALRLRKVRTIRPSIEFRSKAQQRFRLRLNASRRSPWMSTTGDKVESKGLLDELASLFQVRGTLQWVAPLLLIMIILIGTGGGVAYAADTAKPGDFLYAVDKGIEKIRIQLATDKQSIVRLRLQFADERLEEATQLVEAGDIESVAIVIEEYKELMVAATPLIVEAYIAGEDVQSLLKETNEAIAQQEKKLQDLAITAPIEVEEIIKLALKDIKDIRIVVAAPLPTRIPVVLPSPSALFSPTDLGPPWTSTPEPVPTSWPTSTGTLIPGPSPTVGAQIPSETPTPPTSASGTPTATTNPYVTPTPTGTATITVTPTNTGTPGPTYTPTPTRTVTRTPTRTGTPTPTEDGPPAATEPPRID
jgi:hypothetical protein